MKRFNILAAVLLAAFSAMGQTAPADKKLSPDLRSFVSSQSPATQHRAPSASQQMLSVLAKFSPEADVADVCQRYGAESVRTIGDVHILLLPAAAVGDMAADNAVLRLEASAGRRTMTDLLPSQIGADKAQSNSAGQLPQAFTGSGVVVGIVDSGFDFIHPMFRDANGTTRIKWASDYMTLKTYNNAAEVTAAAHSSDAATMLHGTHVMGIAAGSEVRDNAFDENYVYYSGIAREADIAVGAVNSEYTDNRLPSAQTVMAFADIFDYAEANNKPCVINYSMGEGLSFAANHTLEEEAISTLLKKPGRAIVVAAGNAGGTSRYAHKPAGVAVGGAGVCFNDYEQYGTSFGIELKVKPSHTVSLQYTNSNYSVTKGEVSMTADEWTSAASPMLGSKMLKAQQVGQTDDGYSIVYITTASVMTTFETSERIKVTISGDDEAWLYADATCAQLENINSLPTHQLAEDGYSVCWPGAMDEVITVGNIARRLKIVTAANKYASQGGTVTPTDLTEWESTKGEGFLARSSSVGPTLRGDMKPDVCAPGVNIVSALNNFINENTEYDYASWFICHLDTEYEENYGYSMMLAQTGTSMSAPAVAGTIALWMQADPTLTTDRIKDILAHSCRQPESSLTYPNNLYGYGEIDAYRGLLYMLGLSGIHEITQSQPQKTIFRLDGRQLHITFADGAPAHATVRIFTADGRQILSTADTTVNLSSLSQGVYAVQVNTANSETTGSTLIRL